MAREWRRYVVAPTDLQNYAIEDAADAMWPGLYFLWGGSDQLLYVGLSNQVCRRILAHRKAGAIPFADFSALRVRGRVFRSLFLERIEAAYIHALECPHNTKAVPPYSAEMVDAIRSAWQAHEVAA